MARYTIDKSGNVIFLHVDERPTITPHAPKWSSRKKPTGPGSSSSPTRKKAKPSPAKKQPVPTAKRPTVPNPARMLEKAARTRATEEASKQAEKRRRQEQEERRRQAEEKAARIRADQEALRRREEKFAARQHLSDFDEARALGVEASKVWSSDYPLAIAAFKRAYRLDPRRKVRSGSKPDPGLFEIPTRLAAAYRMNGQFYESQKMYEWVLKHHDSQIARMNLAAVHEYDGKHSEALKLYEESVLSDPHDMRALRGVSRTLDKLGRGEEAHEAYKRVLRASRG